MNSPFARDNRLSPQSAAGKRDLLADRGEVQSTNGQRLLRFDTVIANVGAGRFEAHGTRSGASTPTMRVHQHVYTSAGGFRDRSTKARMYYSGDGHDHWHLRNMARYTLAPLSNDRKARSGAKEGFCIYDNYRFGSSAGPFYRGCANGNPGTRGVRRRLLGGCSFYSSFGGCDRRPRRANLVRAVRDGVAILVFRPDA